MSTSHHCTTPHTFCKGCLCWCHGTEALSWTPEYWDSAIANGIQVCVEHKGVHLWTWIDVRNGFCMDVQQIERLAEARLEEARHG